MNTNSFMQYIEESNLLPVMPNDIGEIINMINNPISINAEELSIKIDLCGNLRDNLLLNINSGYFKLYKKVENITDAIVLLGFKTVQRLILAYIVKTMLPDSLGKSANFDRDKYWKHCLATSIAASKLLSVMGLNDEYRFFSYGILHDIGILVLDICRPDIIQEIFRIQERHMHQIVAERIVMKGITHTQIGVWLCKKWKLPSDVQDIIEFHHTPLEANKLTNEIAIMSIADAISTLYYERLLSININYVLNEKVMNFIGISKEQIHVIANSLPEEVERANKLLNFRMLTK